MPYRDQTLTAPTRLEELPRRKERLHHDVRQSLTVVMSLAAVVEHNLDRIPEVLRRLEQMRTETDWLSTLVSNEGPHAADGRPVDVGEVVTTVWRSACATSSCRVRLTRDLVPPVTVDEVGLARAVRNLLDNACRASGNGGTVELAVVAAAGGVAVVVEDDGPGFGNIPTQHGLGLETVHRFAATAGATLERAAGRSGGTRVVLTVPVAASYDGEAAR